MELSHLYLLQFACCIITAMLSLMLVVSRFQIRWLNKRYEASRWLLVLAMAGLSLHYVLQMVYKFRASSDEVGAVINLLFYTPIAFLVSYATYNVVCTRAGRLRFIWVSILDYVLMMGIFIVSYLWAGSLRIGAMLYVMLALFVACMGYFIYTNYQEMRRRRILLESETAADMLPYDRYMWTSYFLMCVTVLMLAGAILSRALLLFVGPLMLVALFLFTMTYIAFGFNIVPADIMLEEEYAGRKETVPLQENSAMPSGDTAAEAVEEEGMLEHRRVARIEEALAKWCEAGGFRDSAANMSSLSQKVHISRDDLSTYFERHLKSSFRVWLSDIRFKEAQRMLQENPRYSNDTISVECGFSSHAHLYKIFKAKTGLTPGQWKESCTS